MTNNGSMVEAKSQIDPLEHFKDLIGVTQALFGPEMAPLFIKPNVCVLDSSYVLSDIRRYLRDMKPTVLMDSLSKGLMRAVGPRKLYSEVMDHLREINEETHIPLMDLGNIWNDHYSKYINYLEVEPDKYDKMLKNLRDPEDREFVQVYESSSADMVLTRDDDLKEFGISPHDSLRFLIDMRHYARGQTISMMMTFAGGAVAISIFGTAKVIIQALIALVSALNKKIPWLFPSLIISMTIALCIPKSREYILQWIKKVVDDFNRMTKQGKVFASDVTNTLFDAYGHSILRSFDAKNAISQLKPVHQQRRLADFVIRALLESSYPLTVSQIQERVKVLGYEPRGEKWDTYLRKVLYSNKNFTNSSQGHWVLSGVKS